MLALRIVWLGALALLFVAIVSAMAGPWMALIALVVLVRHQRRHGATLRLGWWNYLSVFR